MAEYTKPVSKGEVLTQAHIDKRNADAKAAQKAAAPAGVRPGDWAGVQKSISSLEQRVAALEHKAAP